MIKLHPLQTTRVLIRNSSLRLNRGRHHSSESRAHHSSLLNGLVQDLSAHLPRFTSPTNAIKVLKEPSQFYLELLTLIRTAKRRIFIASLYVGREETDLIEAMGMALDRNKGIQLTILVDYLRSTREDSRGERCSASLLGTLKARFPDRVEIRLFHTSELFGTLKRLIPRRFDEGFGLQHMKIYGADSDVIMSGANLSADYFTNRQDRYVKLSRQKELSSYLYELIQLTSSISYRLEEGGGEEAHKLKIVWPETNSSGPPIDSKRASQEFKATANRLYKGFTERWRLKLLAQHSNDTTGSSLTRVSIFPTLQISPFKIHHETGLMIPKLLNLVHQLSHHSPCHRKTILNWTSGYFSLLREYKSLMLSSNAHVEIITASPQANGFFQSKGVSKYIPTAYNYLENMFRKEVVRANKQEQIVIRRWNRVGWTYHAKGLWINERTTRGEEEGVLSERCVVTSIGSSNYGRRSAERDLECNLFMVLDYHSLQEHELSKEQQQQQQQHMNGGESLSRQFIEELDDLKAHLDPLDHHYYHVPFLLKLITRFIRNML